MSLLNQSRAALPPKPKPAPAQQVKPTMNVEHPEAMTNFIENVRKEESRLAFEDEAKKVADREELEKIEEASLKDPWMREVKETMDRLSLEDLLFKGFTSAEIEIIPGCLWVTYKSLANDILNNLMAEALKDTSGEPMVSYESHYAMLILVESVDVMRSKEGDMRIPRIKGEKYSHLSALNSNLVRKLIDKYNVFDASVTRLITDGPTRSVVEELKK